MFEPGAGEQDEGDALLVGEPSQLEPANRGHGQLFGVAQCVDGGVAEPFGLGRPTIAGCASRPARWSRAIPTARRVPGHAGGEQALVVGEAAGDATRPDGVAGRSGAPRSDVVLGAFLICQEC